MNNINYGNNTKNTNNMNNPNNLNNQQSSNKKISKTVIAIIISIILIIILLVLIFTNKEYKVTFKYYGNNEQISETVNQKITEPVPPQRDGYTFIGWYVGNTKFDFNTKIENDIIITAKWQKNTSVDTNDTPVPQFPDSEEHVTIIFDSNGGSEVQAILIGKGEVISEPETPIREGYIFTGWYTSANTLFDFTNKIEYDITLYAIWKEEPKNNQETPNPNEPNEPIPYFIVSFNSNGGSTINAIKIERGKTIAKPSNPTRDGYTFTGWYTNSNVLFDFNTPIDNNITLYAKWQKNNSSTTPTPSKQYVTVTFDSAGGSNIGSISIEKGKTIPRPNNPTRSGYTFTGWYTSSNTLFDFNTPINNNITLYAKWQKNESTTPTPSKQYVTVTFNSNGGSIISAKKIEKGSTVSKPANPTRSGYEFVGWYNSGRTEFNFSTKINSNITLSALWAPKISYTKYSAGKFIFINNPESLVLNSYLADEGHTSLYADTINGNTEIFYSHNVNGPLSGQIYYAFRVYNPSTTKSVTLTINNCGITSSWDEITVWEQYYNKTCNSPKTLTIQPQRYKYIFHNDNKFTFGDEADIVNVKKPTTVFHGVLNVSTTGELKMAALAFKNIKNTYNNSYSGNFEGVVQTAWTKTLDERYTSGYHQSLPIVNNNMNIEIYNETPRGNLKVSYVNPSGTIKIDNGWVSNFVGARLVNNKPQIIPETQNSDILEFQVPKKNKGTVTYGAYPLYKETGNAIHPTVGVSIKGWQYSLANWGVHYNENIKITNNSNSDKSISFVINDAENVAVYYNNKLTSCKSNQDCTVWTVTVKAHQTKTIPAILTLATNTNDYIGKKIVLNN